MILSSIEKLFLTTTWITSASWTLALSFPSTKDSPPDLTKVENRLKLVLVQDNSLRGIDNCGQNLKRRQFFVSTTDGAGVAAVSILDKEQCNWAIRGHFSVKIFLPQSLFSFFKLLWVVQTKYLLLFQGIIRFFSR